MGLGDGYFVIVADLLQQAVYKVSAFIGAENFREFDGFIDEDAGL